ncbi:MAG: helix-turn-helix transcriptional regulator [Bacteroidota bacterium]
MNAIEENNIPIPPSLVGRNSTSKISKILNACECSKNLMISIYHPEYKRFIYCNKRLKVVLGNNCRTLVKSGWDFWFSLVDAKEVASIKHQIINFLTPPYLMEVTNLQYHMVDYYGKKIKVKHEVHLHELESRFLAVNYFFDVSDKERIEHCFVTDSHRRNARFSTNKLMTISPREKQVLQLIANGYSSKEIANKLFISNHTAVSHRKNLIEKFQVKNTAHLVKKASSFIAL